MWSLYSVVFTTSLLLSASSALNCSIPPVYVDIHDRDVHGTGVQQYGSFLGMGTPAQNLSLWPSIVQNETSVAAEQFCGNSTLADCRANTGGLVDVSQSTSWKLDHDYQTADLTETAFNDSFGGNDVLVMYTHYFRTDPAWQTLLPNFTFTMATSGSRNPGILGMGQRSTMLQRLFEAGMIAGHTYALYIGNSFKRAGGQAIGSNTFGGYDPRRFEGEVHNYSMQLGAANPLQVRVSDVVLDDPTGFTRNVSLLNHTAFPDLPDDLADGFDARITTDQFPFRLPRQVVRNYKRQLGAVASNEADRSLQLSKPYNGTMTVVLNDGFRVTIPPEMMFNDVGLSPVEDDDGDEDYSDFFLGSAWLTQVYLMMDYENYSFHLAQAIPMAPFNQPTTWCPRTVPRPAAQQRGGRGFASNGMIGAVIGGVIGGLALIALALWLYVWWVRRQMVKAERRMSEDTIEMTKADFEQVPSDYGGAGVENERARLWRKP
ncbi:putative peptidase a1 [Botryosphaeria dothidea]|uniref:Peptidase a1 n=1 Tax=Botryosphaeria dothidea TaxID=55169 RepID=A0A8H4IMV1_9PEZI|nr:putative peptidase a1 [Botryosphaeria dothidea]